jgi:alcohol oxidase
VLFDEQEKPPRAVGVEYIPDPESKPATSLSRPDKRSVKATKLVVVSAGALGSPQILERSGVGSSEILQKLNIKVVSEVPGVGEKYQDHHLLLYPYKSSLDKSETLDELLSGRKEFKAAVEDQDPRLGWNAIGKSIDFQRVLETETNCL